MTMTKWFWDWVRSWGEDWSADNTIRANETKNG